MGEPLDYESPPTSPTRRSNVDRGCAFAIVAITVGVSLVLVADVLIMRMTGWAQYL